MYKDYFEPKFVQISLIMSQQTQSDIFHTKMLQNALVSHLKLKNIKLNFCCYHVQISLIMSQRTQSDIFHTKMLHNALWCQITWSKCMLCNILIYCSQNTGYTWTEGIATHFIFIYDFIIIGNMLLNVFLQ